MTACATNARATTPATITGAAPVANVGGGLTIQGSGTVALSGVNTYSGATWINSGTLTLSGNSALSNTTNIIVGANGTFDVSAISFNLGSGQSLSGFGAVNGLVTAGAGAKLYAGTDGTYGTNNFLTGLQLTAGAAVYLDLGTSATGSNDQLALGSLTANNNVIHIKAPSPASRLDTTADYVLLTAGSITGSFASAPVWDVAPLNSGNFSVVTTASAVTLHYAPTAAPTAVGVAQPATVVANQSTVVSVIVTPGTGVINPVGGVVVDLSPLGGTALTLVRSNLSNVYTNSLTIPAATLPGSYPLTATVTDSTPLTGSAVIALTVGTTAEVWNGAGGNPNWSTNPNWVSGYAPGLAGDSIVFAGTTDLAPNLDNNLSVNGLSFSNNAGSFTLGSANGSTLTLTGGGIANNSANAQTVNVPVVLAAAQTFNATAGNLNIEQSVDNGGVTLTVGGAHTTTLAGTVSGTGGLTKNDGGTLTLSGDDSVTGALLVNRGTLNLSGSVTPATATVGNAAGNAVANLTGSGSLTAANLFVGNASGAVAAMYQTGGSVSLAGGTGDLLNVGNVSGTYGYYNAAGGTLTLNGISIGGESNPNVWPPAGTGDGIFEVNVATINNSGWIVLARGGAAETGILNVYSGSHDLCGRRSGGELAVVRHRPDGDHQPPGRQRDQHQPGVNFRSADTGILNLNGGLLAATAVTGAGTLNFNGGTLQAAAASGAFVSLNSAYVYGGGAVIDNNGTNVAIPQALLAPTGNGVGGIAGFTGGAGYIAPPILLVTNGVGDTTGTGATAIAQIDPAAGTVTNIIITCPGVNYTATPVFLVSGGGATTPATITGLAPVANLSGGLTSVGTGTLSLTAANTYTGNTTVSAGTLELTLPFLAATSTVTIKSGAVLQLDFTNTNPVAALVLNGVTQPAGVYNSTTAAGYITGAGSLVVAPAIASTPASLQFSLTGSAIHLAWPADHLGWILQAQTNGLGKGISTNWFDVAGSAGGTSSVINPDPKAPAVFYRLRHP